jgi:hypothetical protein
MGMAAEAVCGRLSSRLLPSARHLCITHGFIASGAAIKGMPNRS